jgi:uncharacterized protein YdeI (BOF family)
MKKILVLATAAFLVTGIAFATNEGGGKGKKKAKAKSGKHCGKGSSCCKDEKKTAKM